MLVRYEQLDRLVGELERRALWTTPGSGDPTRITAVNALPERRRGLIEAPGNEPVVIELDGFDARTVELTLAQPHPPAVGRAIESDCIRLQAEADGTLTILDKRTGRRFEHAHRLEDELDMGDLYNFCPVDGAGIWRSDGAAIRILRDGPLVHELEIQITAERPAGLDDPAVAPLSVSTVVRLIDGIRRVEFRTTVENGTKDHRLRAVFPIPGKEDHVRAEGQFALVNRPPAPPEPRTEWIEPPDPTNHTLGAVALGPLAVLTRGLPEYEARPAGDGYELCLTLLRAVGLISRPTGAIATRPLGAGPSLATPEGQCLGRHELEYALLPGADDLDATALLRASQDYRNPFVLAPAGTDFASPVRIDGDVVFSCLKGAEDGNGVILRCFNPGDTRAAVRIAGEFEVTAVRMDETAAEDLTLDLEPGQIGTFRLTAGAAAA